MHVAVPETTPQLVAPETFLIPNLAHAGEDLYLPVNSLVIRGAEPVIVDTGAPIHREQWLQKVFSLVDPEDVRWIFLSHDDGDHTGALLDVLEMCPNATFVTNFFSVERLELEKPPLPLERMRWLDEGESLDVGDRTLHLFKPPIFDGPTTRGIYDAKTSAMWIVDSFAILTPGAVHRIEELPADLVEENLPLMNSMVSPWHQWLDPVVYGRHLDDVAALRPTAIASAHGPIITGDAISRCFESLRELAGRPIYDVPGQALLDELIAATLVESAA